MTRGTRALCIAVGLSLALSALPAFAEREHRVGAGQSLSRIARRYRVTVHDLAAANQLRVTSELREGQVLRIPERGVHYVRRGDSLSEIAREHHVSVRDLARANRLRPDSAVRIGQRLLIPGHDAVEAREEAERRWGRPRNPGLVKLFRVSTGETLRVRLVDDRGRSRNRRRLAHLMRHSQTNREHLPDRRLMQVLTQVSDHFGGRQINVLSGFRPAGGNTQEDSRHVSGDAIDLRISGVNNRELRDYLRTLDRVGVGYYPNSTFVHLDVRDRKAFWVDRSGRGEDPDYVRDRAAREQVDPTESDADADANANADADAESEADEDN